MRWQPKAVNHRHLGQIEKQGRRLAILHEDKWVCGRVCTLHGLASPCAYICRPGAPYGGFASGWGKLPDRHVGWLSGLSYAEDLFTWP